MSDHSTARSLFDLNPVMSTRRRTAALEAIAEGVVADACKPHKPSGRKPRAKTSINARSLPPPPAHTPPTSPAAASESATTAPYTIHWDVWYDGALIWQTMKLSTTFDYHQINAVCIQKLGLKVGGRSIIQHFRIATLRSNSPKESAESSVDKPEEFQELYKIAVQSVKDKRKSVQIDIAVRYGSKSNGVPIDTSSKSSADLIDDASGSDSTDKTSTSLSENELRSKRRAKKMQKESESEEERPPQRLY